MERRFAFLEAAAIAVILYVAVAAYTGYVVRFRDVPSPDINQDGEINIFDLVAVGRSVGSVPGDPKWNPAADMNLDNKIDVEDLSIIVGYFR